MNNLKFDFSERVVLVTGANGIGKALAERFAKPEEIAAAAMYLASHEAAMVNGTDLHIDGGYAAI